MNVYKIPESFLSYYQNFFYMSIAKNFKFMIFNISFKIIAVELYLNMIFYISKIFNNELRCNFDMHGLANCFMEFDFVFVFVFSFFLSF